MDSYIFSFSSSHFTSTLRIYLTSFSILTRKTKFVCRYKMFLKHFMFGYLSKTFKGDFEFVIYGLFTIIKYRYKSKTVYNFPVQVGSSADVFDFAKRCSFVRIAIEINLAICSSK